MTSAVPVSGSTSKYVKEGCVSPNAVAARWPVPPEYLCDVANQQQQGGPNKNQSESFHTHLHAEVGGGVHRASPLGLPWLPWARGQAARTQSRG
jgi:hypothetical protein